MDAMKLFWGLVIALLGLVFIGVNVGWWNSSVWLSIVALWPVILIVVGLKLIVQDGKLLSLLLLGVILLAILFVGFSYKGDNNFSVRNNEFMGFRINNQIYSEDFTDTYNVATTKSAKVTLSTGAAKVNIKALPAGTATDVLYQVKSQNMGKISVDKTETGDSATLVINESNVGVHFSNRMMTDRQIDLYLPASLILDLTVDSGATKLNLDFTALRAESVNLRIGASSGDIYLSNLVARQSLKLDAGASSIVFHVPASLGVKATLEGGLNSVNRDSALNMIKNEDIYTTSGFDSATNQIVISGSTGVSSIRFVRE